MHLTTPGSSHKVRTLYYWVESKYRSKREREIWGCSHLPATQVFAVPVISKGFDLEQLLSRFVTADEPKPFTRKLPRGWDAARGAG